MVRGGASSFAQRGVLEQKPTLEHPETTRSARRFTAVGVHERILESSRAAW